MKKLLSFLLTGLLLGTVVFAQSADDDLFNSDPDDSFFDSSDDDFFGGSEEDDFFGIDTLDVAEAPKDSRSSELSHGALFETGSIKLGGTFNTSVGTMTTLYADDEVKFSDRLKDTTLTPTVDATLTLDARPTQTLRMFTKFAYGYPFNSSVTLNQSSLSPAAGSGSSDKEIKDFIPEDYDWTKFNPEDFSLDDFDFSGLITPVFQNLMNGVKITDFLRIKELFTDFEVADRAYFRFGIHTVTWGAGYFFSPVSDMINTSSIDPENTDAQVDGCLNLRTQITFPDSMNCLWIYVVPSTDFITPGSVQSYLRDTALAAKGDILVKDWELGFGGYYRYQKPLKLMMTATGSIKKVGLFGETVFQLGSNGEWLEKPDFSSKSAIMHFTVGANYFWKDPSIVLAAQYYYDGNHYDKLFSFGDYSIPRITEGHNFALVANFGKLFGSSDINATVFGMVNFGKEEMNEDLKNTLKTFGISIPTLITSAMISYRPIKDFTISGGPYIVLADFDSKPTVSLKLTATLGGGKF